MLVSLKEYVSLTKGCTTYKRGKIKMFISRKKYEELIRDAYYDAKTGCYNRNWFEKVFKKEYSDKRVNIAILDINGLKDINDSFGHSAGDEKIDEIADMLSTVGTVVRWGGDEFYCIIKDENLQEFKNMCANQDDFAFAIGKDIPVKEIDKSLEEIDKLMYHCKISQKKKKCIDAKVVAISKCWQDCEDYRDEDCLYGNY